MNTTKANILKNLKSSIEDYEKSGENDKAKMIETCLKLMEDLPEYRLKLSHISVVNEITPRYAAWAGFKF